jgi:hypothetical protein
MLKAEKVFASSTLASAYTAGDDHVHIKAGEGDLFETEGDFWIRVSDGKDKNDPAFTAQWIRKATGRSEDTINLAADMADGTTDQSFATAYVDEVIGADALLQLKKDLGYSVLPPVVGTVAASGNFPGGLQGRGASTLAAAIETTNGTSATVADGDSFIQPVPFLVQIGTELVKVTSKGSGEDWTIARGYGGSTAATHAASDAVVEIYAYWVNQGTATVTVQDGAFTIVSPSGSNTPVKMLVRPLPAGPYSIEAILEAVFESSNYSVAGIVLRESATAKCEMFGLIWTGQISRVHFSDTGTDVYNDAALYADAKQALFLGHKIRWVVADDETNLSFSLMSSSGASRTISHARGLYFTAAANEMGIGLRDNSVVLSTSSLVVS